MSCRVVNFWSVLLFVAASLFCSVASAPTNNSVATVSALFQTPNVVSGVIIGGQEFYRVDLKVDWFTAVQTCLGAGMRLIQINSEAKQNVIQSVLNQYKVESSSWIGLTDQRLEGAWRWDDGSLALFNNWSGMENSDGKNCASIGGYGTPLSYRYKWSPIACELNYNYFVCETYE